MKRITKERKRELYLQIEPVAQDARNRIIAKDSIIQNSFELLEQLGFFIVGFPARDNSLSGFHTEKSNMHFIYINTGQDLGRQYFSIWHEYYHIFSGEKSDISLTKNREVDEVEYKAECFAGCMLMPSNIVHDYLVRHKIDLRWLSHAALIKMFTYFGVSYNAMLTRLIQLFPDYTNLNRLYGLSRDSRREEFLSKIRQYQGNEELIHPTNRLYITGKFFDDLQFNIENNRISNQKAHDIIDMLNNIGKK